MSEEVEVISLDELQAEEAELAVRELRALEGLDTWTGGDE